MGLSDRDYMRERAQRRAREEDQALRRTRERPFTPPEPTFGGTVNYIFGFVGLALLCVKGYHWWTDTHRTPAPVPVISTPAPTDLPDREVQARRYPQLTGNWDPNRTVPAYRAVPQPATTAVVTKCVVNGRVTFSDAPCEAGANASQLAVNGNRNMADGRPVPAPAATMPDPMRQVVVQNPPQSVVADGPDPAAARQLECAAHDRAIQSIDDQARQPLGPAQQDWLSARRREHRDAQFRLHC